MTDPCVLWIGLQQTTTIAKSSSTLSKRSIWFHRERWRQQQSKGAEWFRMVPPPTSRKTINNDILLVNPSAAKSDRFTLKGNSISELFFLRMETDCCRKLQESMQVEPARVPDCDNQYFFDLTWNFTGCVDLTLWRDALRYDEIYSTFESSGRHYIVQHALSKVFTINSATPRLCNIEKNRIHMLHFLNHFTIFI